MYSNEQDKATKDRTVKNVNKIGEDKVLVVRSRVVMASNACHHDGQSELNFLAELFLRVSGSIKVVSELRPVRLIVSCLVLFL